MVPLIDPSFGAGGVSTLRSRRERGPGSAGTSPCTQSDLGVVPFPRGPWCWSIPGHVDSASV